MAQIPNLIKLKSTPKHAHASCIYCCRPLATNVYREEASTRIPFKTLFSTMYAHLLGTRGLADLFPIRYVS